MKDIRGLLHDFGNMLTIHDAKIYRMQSLQLGNGDNEDLRQLLDETAVSLNRIKSLWSLIRNQVETKALAETFKSVLVGKDFAELVAEDIPRIKQDHNVEIETKSNMNPKSKVFITYEIAIRVTENIVGNCAAAGATKVIIVFEETEDLILVKYRDNGSGMSEDQLIKLGTGFSTRKGGGLGVEIVRSLVQQAGGYMKDPVSIPGIGSEITIVYRKDQQ